MAETGDQKLLARSAMERSHLYSLLATIFRDEPSPELLSYLQEPDMMSVLDGAGVNLGDAFAASEVSELAEQLVVDFTVLFLGPGHHISPHESVQLKRGSGILWGPETSAVRRAYRAAGFDVCEVSHKIPDHISVELDFLSHLTSIESEAWAAHDDDQITETLSLQHSFLSQHLGKWSGSFCAKIRESGESGFYTAFAELLRDFLSGEKSDMAARFEELTHAPSSTASASENIASEYAQ